MKKFINEIAPLVIFLCLGIAVKFMFDGLVLFFLLLFMFIFLISWLWAGAIDKTTKDDYEKIDFP